MRLASVRSVARLLLALATLAAPACHELPTVLPTGVRHIALPPLLDQSVRFAVIGDSGTGNAPQYEIARRMAEARESFPFEFVLMLGDNLYGLERPVDYQRKFELPYAALLEQKVEFYAALGNHDNPNQRFYEPFHMKGERYYAFEKGNAIFLALDSNYMDEKQLEWIRKELESSTAAWKICFFHHPPYSSGGFHGSEVDLRELLEPLFVEYGVRVVFAGHEHFYERIHPQKDVHYFIVGASAKLRPGNIRRTPLTAAGFDTDLSFLLVEIAGDELHFEAISRAGELIDSGSIPKLERAEAGARGAADRSSKAPPRKEVPEPTEVR